MMHCINVPVSRRIYVKSFMEADGVKLPVCLLTYPEVDAAGDYVKPDGGDWTWHDTHPTLNRRVNFDHGVLIGRAENPDGSYGVSLRQMKLDDGKTALLPVGVTKFFQSAKDTTGLVSGAGPVKTALQVAEQVQDLVGRKIMQGVSLELGEDERKPGLWKALGRSPLENRNAWRCDHWIGLGWAHTFMPINRHSQVIDEATGALISLAENGRIGSKTLAAPLQKSLSPYLAIKRNPIAKSGFSKPLVKSMAEEIANENIDGMPEDAPSADTPDANKPTPNAIHQILQSLADISGLIDSIVNGPDHEHAEGLALLEETSTQIQGVATKLMSDASALFPDAGFEVAPEEGATEPDGDEMPTTDDGGLMTKAFKRGYPKRLRVVTKQELQKAEGTVTISVAALKKLQASLAKIGKTIRV